MSEVKHIHEVIFLIEENNKLWLPENLIEAIAQTWGEDIQFSSCSGTAFPKEEALDFLLNRNKVIINKEGKIELHSTMKICNGHENFNSN